MVVALLAAGSLAAPLHGQDPGPVLGSWHGSLSLPGAELPLVFHVRLNEGGMSATWDSPLQGVRDIPASAVSWDGTTFRLDMANVGASYEGTLDGKGVLVGTFTQNGATFPLTLEHAEEGTVLPGSRRPQNPTGPLPYTVEDVRFPNPAGGFGLAGTLTLPDSDRPVPGVVLVSGSGPQNRDEELMGHKPFLVLADHLTRHGIAVLRYDDRGVAGSGGDFSTATSVDFASDAESALRFLAGRTEVDADAVGVIGHSEGGLVGPMVAADTDAAAFVIMLAGPGTSGSEILLAQSALIARASGLPEVAIAANDEALRRIARILEDQPPASAAPLLHDALQAGWDATPEEYRPDDAALEQQIAAQVEQMNSPWFRYFFAYDPRPTLTRVTVPVLAINGSLDLQVPAADNLTAIGTALAAGGNSDVTVRELAGLNHLFQPASTGNPAEYAMIEVTMDPVALDTVTAWILERFGPAAGR